MILAALLMVAFTVPNGNFDKNVKGWHVINNSGAASVTHDRAAKALLFKKERVGGSGQSDGVARRI